MCNFFIGYNILEFYLDKFFNLTCCGGVEESKGGGDQERDDSKSDKGKGRATISYDSDDEKKDEPLLKKQREGLHKDSSNLNCSEELSFLEKNPLNLPLPPSVYELSPNPPVLFPFEQLLPESQEVLESAKALALDEGIDLCFTNC